MDTQQWMNGYLRAVQDAFGPRIVCAGLQGSRGRGEGNEHSDFDTVLILDRLDFEDLECYRLAVRELPCRELLCGFVSGRDELLCWDRAELTGFYWDVRPAVGDLEFLTPLLTREDSCRSVHSGACGIYHACVHNWLHERSTQVLEQLQKSAFFVLRAKKFCETGTHMAQRARLLPCLSSRERAVLQADPHALEHTSRLLMDWAAELIRTWAPRNCLQK